jgi:hypothetical protein
MVKSLRREPSVVGNELPSFLVGEGFDFGDKLLFDII